jgi:hypothetical protein
MWFVGPRFVFESAGNEWCLIADRQDKNEIAYRVSLRHVPFGGVGMWHVVGENSCSKFRAI